MRAGVPRGALCGALLAAAGVLLAAAPAQAAPDDPVDIPDAALRACIGAALGQPPEDPITEAEAASLTSLTCNDAGISDLTGLQYLTAAQTLTFRGNEISDLSPLQNLATVASLDLFDNAISDIAPLQDLESLTWLNLYVNDVTDLTPFASMTQLTYLTIGDNGITDIGPLAALTNLETLSVLRNRISDLTPLQNLTALRSLAVDDNAIEDLAPLQTLTGLTHLWVGRNRISDLSPLAGLTALTTLGFEGNRIVDISPLGTMPSLAGGFGHGQTATLPDIACGAAQANPVVDRLGEPVPLTGEGYDATTNSLATTVAGTHLFTWDVQANNLPFPFTGTLTQTVLPCALPPVDPPPTEPLGPQLAESGTDASPLTLTLLAAGLLTAGGATLVGLGAARRRTHG